MGYKSDKDGVSCGSPGSSETPAGGGPVFRVGYMIQEVIGSRAALDEIHRRENCFVLWVEEDGVAVDIAGTCRICKGLILEGDPHYVYSEGDEDLVCLGCLTADKGFIFAVRNVFVTSDETFGGWVADSSGRLFNFVDLCDSDWSWDEARGFVGEFSTKSDPFGVYVVQVDLEKKMPVDGSASLVWRVGDDVGAGGTPAIRGGDAGGDACAMRSVVV